MSNPALPILVTRRAELAGEIDTMQGQLQQLHADLASLDAVIRQFDPDYDVGGIRPKYRRAATPAEFGSMSRTVLDTLRRIGAPATAKDIAARIGAERGMHAGDRATARMMVKRVGMALRYQRTNGMVQEAGMDGARVLWEVAA